eukprot:SAG25_NODE_9729_length_360_cov_0.984674_1_plen_31_part_10
MAVRADAVIDLSAARLGSSEFSNTDTSVPAH